MPRALLIDFDGVLRQWPDLADWPYEITEAEIRGVAFSSGSTSAGYLGRSPRRSLACGQSSADWHAPMTRPNHSLPSISGRAVQVCSCRTSLGSSAVSLRTIGGSVWPLRALPVAPDPRHRVSSACRIASMQSPIQVG